MALSPADLTTAHAEALNYWTTEVGHGTFVTMDSHKFPKLAGDVFMVDERTLGHAYSWDNTGDAPRLVAYLTFAEDAEKTPSRRRTRSAYVTDMVPAQSDEWPAYDPTEAEEATALADGIRELDSLITDGTLPMTIASFAEVHDYVDGNEIAGLCDASQRAHWGQSDAVERLQNALDAWLRNRTAATSN